MVTKSLTFLYEEQELQLRHILSFIYHLIALNNNTDYPFTLNNNIVHFLNFTDYIGYTYKFLLKL